jgi:hypothetical protein
MRKLLSRLGVLAGLVIATSITGAPAAHAEGVGEPVSRSEVIARAHYWNALNVPYSQSAYHVGPGESKTYRTDCSGFVSMAWHLADSRWTGSLDDVSSVISYGALKPGDILMRDKDQTSGHVVIFERWTDSSKTAMWIIEEASTAADMNYRTVTVSDRQNAGYIAYTYDDILGDTAGTKGDRGTSGVQCNQQAGQEIDITARRDISFETYSCLVRDATAGTLLGYVVVTWSPGTGSDDSSDTTTSRFDGFKIHTQLQREDVTRNEAACDVTADLNAAMTGSKSCAYQISSPAAGAWTADGYVQWNEDNDGLYWLGPWYAKGSPILTL